MSDVDLPYDAAAEQEYILDLVARLTDAEGERDRLRQSIEDLNDHVRTVEGNHRDLWQRVARMEAAAEKATAEQSRLRELVAECREAFTLIAADDELVEQAPVFGLHAYRHRQDQARYMLGQIDRRAGT